MKTVGLQCLEDVDVSHHTVMLHLSATLWITIMMQVCQRFQTDEEAPLGQRTGMFELISN